MSLRDAERLKDKIEVSLDSRQIFFLFFGGAVVACLVFVLGVMVGRRLENREQVGQRGATSAAVDPLAALDQLGADEAARARATSAALEFPKALGQKSRPPLGSLEADVVPTDDEEPMVAPPGKDDATKKDDAKKGDDAAKKDDAKLAEAKLDGKAKADEKKADKADDKKDDAKADLKAEKKNRKKAKFTLQLSSFQDRAEADSFAAKLVAAGHKPYVVQSNVPDKGTWYRVRLGEYAEHEEAIAAKAEFERTERVIAYVTRL